ncbi:MAG: hypothetical protein HY663_06210 [Chloroflexi bacterium]|nr:hypothetical protein [Chloroflexota bacterium]
MNLWVISVLVFLLNLPFGYWRSNAKRFSIPWFLSIHAPVPFVVAFRFLAGLGWQPITFAVFMGAFSIGQFSGGRLHRWRSRHEGGSVFVTTKRI